MRIREVDTGDIEKVSAFAQKTFIEAYVDTVKKSELEEYVGTHLNPKKFLGYLEDPDQNLLVIEGDSGLLGYAKFGKVPFTHETIPPRTRHLDKLYVLKNEQAKGIGKALLSEIETRLADKGIEYLCLNVWIKNMGAIKFYEKTGFEIVGTIHFKLSKNVTNPNHLFLKPLPKRCLDTF